MNGILCVYKEKDYTSFDVVAVMRKICGTKKIGHGGTLDPMATGVLPIFIGKATKAIDLMPDNTKGYRAGFRLGLVSDTQDITGKIISQNAVSIKNSDFDTALQEFKGRISQIPPMYSAVKVNGKRLYDLARKGIEVERKPRQITVFSIEVDSFDGIKGYLNISCSKGTYVRTIIHDLGQKLGCGAVMTELERTQSNGLNLDKANTLDFYKQLSSNELREMLIPIDSVFQGFPKVILDEKQCRMFKNGVRLDLKRLNQDFDDTYYSVYHEDEFLGIASPDFTESSLVIIKMF